MGGVDVWLREYPHYAAVHAFDADPADEFELESQFEPECKSE